MFIFCPKKQSSSPACRGHEPGLVPSSPHIPSTPPLPGMLPAPPAWTSAPKMVTDSSPTSPLTPKKQFPHCYSCWWGAWTLHTQHPAALGWKDCPRPPHGRGHRRRALSPLLPASVRSLRRLPPRCYQSLLRKDSTQDKSRSDFRACSAPPIKPQAAREDKQSPLSPINEPSFGSLRSSGSGFGKVTYAGAGTHGPVGRTQASRAEGSEEDSVSPPF